MNTVSLNKITNQIGIILKTFREKSGQNQAFIAKKAGISTSMLSQIERSAVSPSIETLYEVCNALGMDIASLFSRLSDKDKVSIYQNKKRLTIRRHGVYYEQLMINNEGAYHAEMFLLEIEPDKEAGFSNKGHEGVEMGYVLSGTATLTMNEKAYQVKSGDSLRFSSTLPHKLKNTGTVLFRAIWNSLPPHKDYLEIES